MRRQNRFPLLGLVAASLFTASCGSSTSSTAPTPPLQPATTTFTLSGQVTSTTGGAISGASITIADGANAGRSATSDSGGNYSLTGLSTSGFTVNVTATNYSSAARSVTLTGNQTLSVQLTPTTRLAFSTTASQGWTSIDVSVGGQVIGTLRRFFEPGGASSCDAVTDARIVATVQSGTIAWTARSDRGVTWAGSQTLAVGACFEVQLTCTNRDCSAAAPLPPPPAPTPPPTSGAFYVWGGSNYTQYLGFFSCVFCSDFGSDSINNQFGIYGSQFSATSIRNQFSLYGSQFSSDSACNQFASSPPRVFNSNRSVYYGELTLNQFRGDAIKAATIVNWLVGDVCKH